MRLKYRMRTKTLYRLKIIQNIICTHLEYQNYIRRQRKSESFVSSDPGCTYCALLPLDSTSCENGYPTAKELGVLCIWGGKSRIKHMQIEFRAQFGMEPRGHFFVYIKWETFKRKACVCKGKRPGWPFVSDAAVLCVWACFQSSLQNSQWLWMKIVL